MEIKVKRMISVLLCTVIAFSSVFFSFAAEAETEISTASASQSTENTSENNENFPQKVSDILADDADSRSITLSWNDVPDADGYNVYIKDEDEKNYKLLNTVEQPGIVIEKLNSGTVYCFKIRACATDENDKTVYGPFSDVFKAATAPAKIKKIVTKSISENSITLSWSAAAGATHYEISYFNAEDNKFVIYGVVEGKQSFEIADLLPGKVYTFRLRAIKVCDNQNAFGEYSDEYSEFTDKDGIPYTKAQIAERYNSAVNSLKESKESFSLDYSKKVDTLVMDCSYPSLISTCRNVMAMFEGEMKKKLIFKDGSSESYTLNSLIEPYSSPSTLKGNDILSFSFKKDGDNTVYSIKLKSENASYKNKKTGKPASNKTVITPVVLQKLKITPVNLLTATQVFDGAEIKLKLSNDKTVKSLSLSNPVLVKADCKVSTVKFSVNVMYEIKESYVFGKVA